MTVYYLIQNMGVTDTPSSLTNPPNVAIAPSGGAGTPFAVPASQSFHAVVTGTGNVSATIHLQVSNDGINWFDYPTIGTMTISSGASPNQASAMGNTPFACYSAYISAISGTGALVNLTMNA